MEVEGMCSKLLEEVRAKISLLKVAVEDISMVKKSLKLTGSDVKAQIRDSISRHLEALRNRETWLLNQVEVVQHIKEDVLRQQQATLNQALGSLNSACTMLEECYESGKLGNVEGLESQLVENLAQLDKLNLQPEETSSITFHGNNFAVQEAIKRFGVVDSDRVFEQQIISSFQDLKVSQSAPEGSIGKRKSHYPSSEMETWLLQKESNFSTGLSSSVTWPNSDLKPTDWLQQSRGLSLRGSHSPAVFSVPETPLLVENWLAKCQPGKTFDLASLVSGDSDSIAAESSPEVQEESKWLMKASKHSSPPGQPNTSGLGQYYQSIKSSDQSRWLKARESSSAALRTDLIGKTYARIMASGLDEWLAIKKHSGKNGSSPCVKKTASACADCVTKKPRAVSETSSELSDWLAVKQDVSESSEDTWVVPVKDIEDAPAWLLRRRSNSSPQGKTTNDDKSGMRKFLQDLSNTDSEEWLKSSPSQTVSNSEAAPKIYVPTIAEGWLLCSTESKPDQENLNSRESFYSDVLSSDSSLWLQQPSAESEATQESREDRSGFKQYVESLSGDYNQWLSHTSATKSDICKWLARSSTDRCKNCPKMCSKGVFGVFEEVANTSDGWLMVKSS